MIEQISMDFVKSEEQQAFELVYPELKSVIMNASIEDNILIFKELDNCSSVYFLDQGELFFRIRIRKKTKYILVPESYEDMLPNGAVISRAKSDAGMIRIAIQSFEDILLYADVLRSILDRISRKNRDFGCCSRYEQCSDAMQCIHPDLRMAIRCWYRYNMLDGKFFYGKNKNVP